MQIILAQPRGFCAGVTRAIAIVERALAVYGPPIYVRHEIVHNKTVVERLREQGAVFVEDLSDVPDGATLIFSAHGVPVAVQQEAEKRGFRIFDATCPLVTKVHREVIRMRQQNRRIIMIGHAGHPEVEGTMGQVKDSITLVQSPAEVKNLPATLDPSTLSYVTQTTISVDDARDVIDALKQKFPGIAEPKKADVCYATQNRQDAVKALAARVDLVLVIGSTTSSNSTRLREVSERCGVKAYLVDSAEHIDRAWLTGVEKVGITAGASAPEALVQGVVEMIQKEFGAQSVTTLAAAADENVAFPMPKGLWQSDLDEARSQKN